MRICFLCGGFSASGGIGRVISILSGRLAESDGVTVFLLSFYGGNTPPCYALSPKCRQDVLYPQRIRMTDAMLKEHAVKKLCGYIERNEIDIIIACGALFYPLTVLAAKKTGIKSICWEHTNPNNKSDYKFQDAARCFGAKRSDCNVVLTKSALRTYQTRFPRARNVQIYSPVDPEAFANNREYDGNCKRILSVGRLRPQKNFSRLLDIAAMVLKDYPDWKWDIFGDGPLRDELEAKNAALGLQNQVYFKGQVPDLYERYHQYSFLVMTSDYEGFPMTLLEGAANRLPMVAFDVPTGPSEIITNERNGFLCEDGDLIQMAYRIERLMTDTSLRTAMSAESRKTSEKFRAADIVSKWLLLYKEVSK